MKIISKIFISIILIFLSKMSFLYHSISVNKVSCCEKIEVIPLGFDLKRFYTNVDPVSVIEDLIKIAVELKKRNKFTIKILYILN